MKKVLGLVAAAMMVFSGSAFADGEKCSKEKCDAANTATAKCDGKTCNKTASNGGCPITAAMASLPQLTFAVDGESLCCEASAQVLAKEANKPVKYIVAKEEFDSKDKAMVQLVSVTEKFVADFATPHTCNVSGKTTIAGASTSCSVTAGKLAKAAQSAMSEVTLAYKVGNETCDCPNKAASLAKNSGTEKLYVIGTETTSCSVDAKLKLARAKYKAAVEALAKLEQETPDA